MRVAIVHDWLYGGGAEKVIEQLHKLYPEAPIYTSYCTPEWRQRLDNKVVTGYLNYWPFTTLRKFLVLPRQWWFASLDLSDYDLVISSTGNGEAKFIRPKAGTTHICYCHSPPHFYWRKYNQYLDRPGFGKADWLARLGLKLLVKPLRRKDYRAAQKVHFFIANSSHIQADIKKYYDRDSEVIYPPINTDFFSKVKPSPNKINYVYWGRHVPDKRIDIAIKACNELKEPLMIAGTGLYTNHLKTLAGPTVKFVGFVDDDQLIKLAGDAKAFLFPSEEDFGIAPVEALSAGIPIIAYRFGGARDYIIPGKTGEFINKQSTENLVKVMQNFDYKNYEPSILKAKAQEFSEKNFKEHFSAFVDKQLKR